MWRPLVLVPAAALVALLMAACAGIGGAADLEIEIIAGERSAKEVEGSNLKPFYFEPKEITVPAGARVRFVIKNTGTTDHEFESDEAHIEEVLVPPGRTRKVTWTAPSKPGWYPVYCDLPGHRENGMELTIIVR